MAIDAYDTPVYLIMVMSGVNGMRGVMKQQQTLLLMIHFLFWSHSFFLFRLAIRATAMGRAGISKSPRRCPSASRRSSYRKMISASRR